MIQDVLLNTDLSEPFPVEVGDRIAQLVIVPVPAVEVVVVDELEETVRGVGGFGSSGRA